MTAEEISAQVGEIVEGTNFRIKKARRKTGEFSDSDHYGIALGETLSGNYATWWFHLVDGIPSFYWGHYYGPDRKAAFADYESRG